MTAFDRATDGILQFFTKEQAEALVAYRGDGKTAVGRTTVEVLNLNSDEQLQLRFELQV